MTDREIIEKVEDALFENDFFQALDDSHQYDYQNLVLVRFIRWIERAKWDDVWLLRLLVKFDAKTIEEIKEGLRAIKEGRVMPWSKIKEELNI